MIVLQGGQNILTAQPASGNFIAGPIDISRFNQFSLQLASVGSPSGNAYLECSTNIMTSASNPPTGTWDPVTGVALIAASGTYTWPIQNAPFPTIRVRWVNLSTLQTYPAVTGALINLDFFGKG